MQQYLHAVSFVYFQYSVQFLCCMVWYVYTTQMQRSYDRILVIKKLAN